jgi:Ca2+:H+ antiporter
VAPTVLFFLSALAVIPLAKLIGDATGEVAVRSGPALSGVLNATFGNAAELLIGFFAIRAGLNEVVKASLTGSIIGNLLLVLGTAAFAGGTHYKTQTFDRTAAHANASTLLLAVIAMAIPAILVQTSQSMRRDITLEELSLAVAALMILTYLAGLWFALRTHAPFYAANTESYAPEKGIARSVAILLGATIAVAAMSKILVSAIEPVALRFGWTQLFIGVVVVAVIGNAAEHTSAVVMATKDKMDLSLQIAIGSATQIAMFVAPVLVFASAGFSTPMNLVFNPFELTAIILSVLIVNQIVADGETNWFQGLQLLVAYAIVATAFFLYE